MPLLLLLIVGILCLLMSGAWIGTIVDDIQNHEELELAQFLWAIFGFIFGTFCIIACIGHVAAVK